MSLQRGRMTHNKSQPRSGDATRLKLPPLHVAVQASLKGRLSNSAYFNTCLYLQTHGGVVYESK